MSRTKAVLRWLPGRAIQRALRRVFLLEVLNVTVNSHYSAPDCSSGFGGVSISVFVVNNKCFYAACLRTIKGSISFPSEE